MTTLVAGTFVIPGEKAKFKPPKIKFSRYLSTGSDR
jgi:hypothetical protein